MNMITRRSVARCLAGAMLAVLMLTGAGWAQTVREIAPGVFAAGIPTDEFEYFAAPRTAGRQHRSNWCWAACIQMVLNYHGLAVSQEDIVYRIFGGNINSAAGPREMMTALNGWARMKNGKTAQVSATTMVFKGSDIVRDLAYHWPIVVGMLKPDGSGHAYVLTAVTYGVDANNEPLFRSVVLRDPWPDNESRIEVSWQEFAYRVRFLARVRVVR